MNILATELVKICEINIQMLNVYLIPKLLRILVAE